MKWLFAMAAGALSGWLIVTLTNEVAIAASAGAAIGILATIALFATNPYQSLLKMAGAMAIGCIFGWVASLLTIKLAPAMVIGTVIGVLATLAVATDRPLRSMVKLIVAMVISFGVAWGLGLAIGDHRWAVALAVPLSMLLLLPVADRVSLPRRPF